MSFKRLQPHAEPEIRHQPLESLVLTVHGFRGLARAPEDRCRGKFGAEVVMRFWTDEEEADEEDQEQESQRKRGRELVYGGLLDLHAQPS